MHLIGQQVCDLSLVTGQSHFDEVGVVVERLLKVKWPDGSFTFVAEDNASVGGGTVDLDGEPDN